MRLITQKDFIETPIKFHTLYHTFGMCANSLSLYVSAIFFNIKILENMYYSLHLRDGLREQEENKWLF
jgi:hypothetical protein